MIRVVAVALLAFVVFTCGDPVNVEKREPVDLASYGHGILGKDGLPNVGDIISKQALLVLAQLLKQIREALQKLNICHHKKGDYKDGGYGHYGPGYKPGYELGFAPGYAPDYKPGYEPGYAPDYKPGYEPGYEPGYAPDYKPGYEPVYAPDYKPGYEPGYEPGYAPDYKPGYEPGYAPDYKPSYEPGYEPGYVPSPHYKRNADLDLGCALKPIIEAAIKFIKALEKFFGCVKDKDDGYKGDYKDCYDDYKKAYPHGYKGY